MQEKLLKCPFCGTQAKLVEDNDHHGDFFSLGCSFTECLAHNIFYTESELSKEDAIKAWNRRAK